MNECVIHKIFEMVKTLKKKRKSPLSLVLLDEQFQGKIASSGSAGGRIFTSIRSKKLASQKNVILVSKASGLGGISRYIREINEKNHLRGLFIRPDVKTELLPKLMHESGVSTLKHTFIHHNPEALNRLLRAWNLGAPDALIADASVADDTLFVVSCSFKFYKIPFAELPALHRVAPINRNTFDIDKDGSYIHWEQDDIHIDIDTLEYHTNPEYRKKADLKRLKYHRQFGDSLKHLRKEAGLRQGDIPGLSARQVRRIENGESTVSVGALEKLAKAMGMSMEEILRKQANKKPGKEHSEKLM